MLRKLLVIAVLAAIIGLGGSGCKKSSDTPAGNTETAKTAADYETEAEKEITAENMEAELTRLEKEIDSELSAEP